LDLPSCSGSAHQPARLCKEALGLLESLFFWLFSIRLIWADTADCGELALWL
jgi:hypothetical protein